MLDDDHPHDPSLRKLIISKVLKPHSCRGQNTSSAPPKDVLWLSKKVGTVKRKTSRRNKDGKEMLSIWREPCLSFLKEDGWGC